MIRRLLNRWLGSRPVIVNVEDFGPRMDWKEVQAALRNQEDNPMFRAVAQIVEFQRQQCQTAVQDKTNLLSGQLKFEAGAAASAADVLTMLIECTQGDCQRPGLREWFGVNRDKSE